MRCLGKKITVTPEESFTVRLYALGNGILATEETSRKNSVSSYQTKTFAPTKKNVTVEQNLERAYKFYNFTEEDIKNFNQKNSYYEQFKKSLTEGD